jgi:hypothetical protein
LAFIVGAPRSGTTWLQLLLYQHPGITTCQETQLFSQYLCHLDRRFRDERTCLNTGIRRTGLSRVLSDREFTDICRQFADQVWDRARRTKPEATVVLEKSPDHVFHAALITRLFPEASFIHVIRDPRAVASSFRHAVDAWWKGPSGGSVRAVRYWKRSVEAGRAIAEVTSRYTEVRFEDLLNDGAAELQKLFTWLDLAADQDYCERLVSRCSIENLRRAAPDVECPWSLDEESEGFFRRGDADAWCVEMGKQEVRVVEHIAADLMRELGYQRRTRAAASMPLRLSFYTLLERGGASVARLAGAIERRAERVLTRL